MIQQIMQLVFTQKSTSSQKQAGKWNLFIIAKILQQPRFPLIGEWVNNCIHPGIQTLSAKRS